MAKRISRRRALAGLSALAGAPRFAVAAAPPVTPRLGKGLNLHHLLNWPDAQVNGDDVVYDWPPFAAARFALRDDELRQITALGFDFVRLTVDPAIWIATPAPRIDDLRDHAAETVQRLLAAGLNVIFDLHPVAQNPRYRPAALVDPAAAEPFQSYLALVERVADMLAPFPPDRLAFELMNEPPITQAAEAPRWRVMLEALHRRARARAPRLPLVLNGIRWDGHDALRWIDTAAFAGDAALYTFHYYEPHTFTLQGVENDTTRYISGLGWPADPANVALTLARATARIASAPLTAAKSAWFATRTRQLLDLYQGQARAYTIAADFDGVADWARARGLPAGQILLGEFGCVRASNGEALGPDRARWLRAVRQAAESRGFPWAYWAYMGHGGMALADADGALDLMAVEALGLARP